MNRRRGGIVVAPFLAMVLVAGCDSTFEPLEESSWVFSIAGHLDPAQDTQWVRVAPLRETIFTDDEPIDAVVTLEELETGRVFTMTPALSAYRPVLEGAEDQYAFNFWTAEPILPGFSYRLTATRSDGASSSAVADIPEDNMTVIYAEWAATPVPFMDLVVVYDVPDLAMVLLVQDVLSDCNYGSPVFTEYQRIVDDPVSPEDPHVVQLDWEARPAYIPFPPTGCQLGPQRIEVIASGGPWPFTASTALRQLMHPNMVGNVENGTGYLAGLLTKVFPREGCSIAPRTMNFCEVQYPPPGPAPAP